MKGGDKTKATGIKKLFSKLMKKRGKDRDEDGSTGGQRPGGSGQATPHKPGISDTTSDLDGYWPVQRKPHPINSRQLPNAGRVQDLVNWFDQKPAGHNETKKPSSRQAPIPVGDAPTQDLAHSRTAVHVHVPPSPGRPSLSSGMSPHHQRQGYFTPSDHNTRPPSSWRQPATAGQLVQTKVESYLRELPLTEASRSSSMPSVAPPVALIDSSSGLLGDSVSSLDSPRTQQSLLLDLPDSDSDVTTIVPVDGSVRSFSSQSLATPAVERPVIHYHLSIRNCNGINIQVSNPQGSPSNLPCTFQVDDGGALKRLSWVEEPPPALAANTERSKYYHSAPSQQQALVEEVEEETATSPRDSARDTSAPCTSQSVKEAKDRSREPKSKGKGAGKGKKNIGKTSQTDVASNFSPVVSASSKEGASAAPKEKEIHPAQGKRKSDKEEQRKDLASPEPKPVKNLGKKKKCVKSYSSESRESSCEVKTPEDRPADQPHAETRDQGSEGVHCAGSGSPSNTRNCESIQLQSAVSSCENSVASADTSRNTSVMSPPLLTASPNVSANIIRPKPQKHVAPTVSIAPSVSTAAMNSSPPLTQQPATDSLTHTQSSHRSSMESITTDILMSECDSCQRDMRQGGVGPVLSYADTAVDVLTRERSRPVALVAPNIRETEQTSPIREAGRSSPLAAATAATAAAAAVPASVVTPSQQPPAAEAALPSTSHAPLPGSPPLSPAEGSGVPAEVVYFHQLQQYQLQQQQHIQQELLNLEQRQELEQLAAIHRTPASLRADLPSSGAQHRAPPHSSSSANSPSRSDLYTSRITAESGLSSPQRQERGRRYTPPSRDTALSSPHRGSVTRPHLAALTSASSRTREASEDLITASSVGGQFRRTRSAPRRIHRSREERSVEDQQIPQHRSPTTHTTDVDTALSDNEDERLPDRFIHLKSQIIRLPGVLILGSRRGRLTVYLSRDRPNIEGVVSFMMQHGIGRHEYECKVLPSRFRVRRAAPTGRHLVTALMAQA